MTSLVVAFLLGQATVLNVPLDPGGPGALAGRVCQPDGGAPCFVADGGGFTAQAPANMQGIMLTPLLAAPGIPTVTPTGATGATNYSYAITACSDPAVPCIFETNLGTVGSTSTGNASLSVSNYNALSWTAVPGAVGYNIRRTVGGATQGIVGTVTGVTFNDTGIAATGYAVSQHNLTTAIQSLGSEGIELYPRGNAKCVTFMNDTGATLQQVIQVCGGAPGAIIMNNSTWAWMEGYDSFGWYPSPSANNDTYFQWVSSQADPDTSTGVGVVPKGDGRLWVGSSAPGATNTVCMRGADAGQNPLVSVNCNGDGGANIGLDITAIGTGQVQFPMTTNVFLDGGSMYFDIGNSSSFWTAGYKNGTPTIDASVDGDINVAARIHADSTRTDQAVLLGGSVAELLAQGGDTNVPIRLTPKASELQFGDAGSVIPVVTYFDGGQPASQQATEVGSCVVGTNCSALVLHFSALPICFCSDNTAIHGCEATPSSSTAMAVTGTATDNVNWMCVGAF